MKKAGKLIAGALGGALLSTAAGAEQVHLAGKANNELGLDLYRLSAAKGENLCLSPYSIQSAFAMAANGAGGDTLAEMMEVLHYPDDLEGVNLSYAALATTYAQRHARALEMAKLVARGRDPAPTFQLLAANRLFGQKGYPFEPAFLKTLEESYKAPLQFADFEGNPTGERKVINEWVEDQTRDRISNLLPDGSINEATRLVLVNALYFKGAWQHEFSKSATRELPFHLTSEKQIETPTMRATRRYGYRKEEGFTAVTLPYSQGMAMLVIIPDEVDGLDAVTKKLTGDKLTALARLPKRTVDLQLPRFKIEGSTISLKKSLQSLGMNLAFDRAKADFDRMTADKTLPGLFISDAFHKTFISVDEKGTEAAAATAIVMELRAAAPEPEEPVEVRADRPFFYAIMDTGARTALFLGHVRNPR